MVNITSVKSKSCLLFIYDFVLSFTYTLKKKYMKIQVCRGKTCSERFSEYILKRLESDKELFHLDNIIIEACPCTGNCQKWPNIVIDGKIEHGMNPIKASKIVVGSKAKFQKRKTQDEGFSSGPFRLSRQDDSVEENIYIKDHINIIKGTDDATDI